MLFQKPSVGVVQLNSDGAIQGGVASYGVVWWQEMALLLDVRGAKFIRGF
jgi:hypothetical protein